MRSSVSLCEKCRHMDRRKYEDLQDTWRELGWPPFKHAWCGKNDQPEDMRWETCPAFEGV